MTYSALLLPSLILLVVVNGYPVLFAAFQAVHDGSLLASGEFVGLDNFALIFANPAFWAAARFTLLFTVVGVFGSWAVGLGLALLLKSDLPGRSTFRVLLLLPWVVPVVVSAISWNWLTATRDSPIPQLASALGLGDGLLLADPTTATIVVLAFKIWTGAPFMMMMAAASLQGVDESVYEAAMMDGASTLQRFRLITLPMIAKSTFISWILMAIFCVNDFSTIWLLTAGGPVNATTSLVVLAYRTVFQNFQTGPGVAIAFCMTFVLVMASVFLYRQIRKSSI